LGFKKRIIFSKEKFFEKKKVAFFLFFFSLFILYLFINYGRFLKLNSG